MKKIFLITILSLGVISAQAQFGVKAGVNVSSWRGDDVDDDDVDALVGFYGGVFYNLHVTDNFSFEPQLVFSSTGAKSSDGDFKDVFGSIDVTALAKYVHESGFFVGTGPQLGFVLSAEEKEDGEEDVDIKDDVKSTQIAWALAAGYDHKSGFGIYVRYNFGFTRIFEDIASTEIDIKQNVAQFGLRWTFNKGGSK